MKIKSYPGILALIAAALASSSFASPVLLPPRNSPEAGHAQWTVHPLSAHETLWRSVDQVTNELTGAITAVPQEFVQLEAGLNHLDEKGEWRSSVEEWELVRHGAVARFGGLDVLISSRLTDADAVDIITGDKVRIASRPLAVGYYDPETGENVIIGVIRDVPGELTAVNEILFRDAVEGQNMSIRYTIRKGSFSQDLLIHEAPSPAPDELGLSSHSRLEFYTELAPQTPQPEERRVVLRKEHDPIARQAMHEPDFEDTLLSFGEYKMLGGKAFALGEAREQAFQKSKLRVGKRLEQIENRRVLIEAVEWKQIEDLLAGLPKAAHPNLAVIERSGPLLLAARRLPSEQPSWQSIPDIQVASAIPAKELSGFVLDYTLQGTLNNYVLRADRTYLVTNSVYLTGNTVIESTVVKFGPAGSLTQSEGSLTCLTTPYAPAIFTSRDDNSVGGFISGATGNPTTFNSSHPYLTISYNWVGTELKHLRMSYAHYGLWYDLHGNTNSLWHSQFINCGTAILVDTASFSLHNVLIDGSTYAFEGYDLWGWGEHVTVHNCANLSLGYWLTQVPSGLAFTNSLFVAVNNYQGIPYSSSSSAFLSSGNGLFTTVGKGSHYRTGPDYRNGTTAITSRLLTELRNKTTHPPLVVTNVYYAEDVTLAPQVPRGAGGTSALALGYLYDPIDYAVSVLAVSNATLRIMPGTVIASHGGTGIWLQKDTTLISEGTPANPIRFTRHYNVQEQSGNWGAYSHASNQSVNPYSSSGVPSDTARFRFTEFYSMHGGGYDVISGWWSDPYFALVSLDIQDCRFKSSYISFSGTSGTTVSAKNNLFEGAQIEFAESSAISARNNLFVGGAVFAEWDEISTWVVRENVFDSTQIANWMAPVQDWNGYVNTASRWAGVTSANDVVLSSFNYATGPLGHYYQQSTGLRSKGSRTAAAAGLFHYTTQSSQTKAGNNTVDMGLHYVALDSNGNPVDTDGDLLFDYLEDANGNGVSDSAETNWQISENNTTGVPGLQVFTPLK
jgi:hypothetical protein